MRKIWVIISCLAMLFTMNFMVACGHEHSYEESVEIDATCGAPGTMKKTCTDCNASINEEIPATGNHSFGNWVQSSSTSAYRTCTVCGAVESSSIENSGGAHDNSVHAYTTFSSFVDDCIVSSSDLTYNGQYNKLMVSLGAANTTDSCEGKIINIPSRVTDIQFVGLSNGSPFSNVRFNFDERVNDINLTFNDVRIESQSTIVISESRNINFNITMIGNNCSFIVLGKGADGADGEDGVTNDSDRVYGKDGKAGVSAFVINGNVTIDSQVSRLSIKGGDGGNGGDGGHIATSKAPSGGDGGNGADAVKGEKLFTLIISENCNADVSGGTGGKGGAGGKSEAGYWGSNRTGKAGQNGANGTSGCDIVYK